MILTIGLLLHSQHLSVFTDIRDPFLMILYAVTTQSHHLDLPLEEFLGQEDGSSQFGSTDGGEVSRVGEEDGPTGRGQLRGIKTE